MTPDLPLTIAGIAIALAVPMTFMVANWVRKHVDHGEMRFDTRNTRDDQDHGSNSGGPSRE